MILKAMLGLAYRENKTTYKRNEVYYAVMGHVRKDRSLIQTEDEMTGPFLLGVKTFIDSTQVESTLTQRDLQKMFNVSSMCQH